MVFVFYFKKSFAVETLEPENFESFVNNLLVVCFVIFDNLLRLPRPQVSHLSSGEHNVHITEL